MKNETIVDRVVARLKAQPLGDLITEEDLHDIVKEAIPKVFFETRLVRDPNSYSGRDTEIEPAIYEVMRDLLRESAKEAVKLWITENTDKMAMYWQEVCDQGLLKYVSAIQNDMATAQVRGSLQNLFNELNKERAKMGMPMIGVAF